MDKTPADASAARQPVGLVAATGVAHLLSALGLVALLDVDALAGGTVMAAVVMIVAIVGTTTLVAFATTRRALGTGGPDRVARIVPPLFGLVPLLSGVPLAVLVAADLVPILQVVTVFAGTTAAGIALALTLEQVLTSLVARHTPASDARAATQAMPPSLGQKLARQAIGLIVGGGLIMLAHALLHGVDIQLWMRHGSTYVALLGTGVTLICVVFAAASAGLSPGRDVMALAARLDGIGWDEARASSRRLTSAVRVTSFDSVGQLFAELERLRDRLAKDVETYQHALDRTEEADRIKAEFLAAVSHELRTPLDSIMGMADALLETELTEAQREDIRLILAGGKQLRELIEDILDLSMIESGDLELRFAACSLVELAAELVELHQAQVHDRDVELKAEFADGVPPVTCDRRRIGQVVTNLLSNAIKFTESGSVTVRVRMTDRGVSITVEDTGIGIAEDELQGIFEEFQQAGTRKRKLRGTGLGLAIARRIVEAHGGSLTATSVVGEGSIFVLDLPADGEAAEREREREEAERERITARIARGGSR